MKKQLLFFTIFVALFLNEKAVAQCTENLAKAQSEFDDGHLYGIPLLLNSCIEKGTLQEKLRAYELLTITYLYIDDPNAAQESFKKLLELDPEYDAEKSEYIELVHLSKEFITRPIVSWRVRGGANVTTITSIYNNGSNNTNIQSEKYSLAAGWTAIGSLDIHFTNSFSFSLEPELSYNSYNYSDTFFNIDVNQNSKDILNLKENVYNVSLPVSFKYTYKGDKFSPYLYAGYSPNYTVNTSTNGKYRNIIGTAEIKSEDKISLNELREPFSQSVVIGIGLMRRVKYKYVFVDVRYKLGLSNRLFRDGQDLFDSNDDVNKYLLKYLMVDNDFRQNEINLTVGYIWPQYNARKRKSVTIKSFIGGLFKKDKNE